MSKFHSVDMHCDTLMQAFLDHGDGADVYDLEGTMVNIPKLLQGGALAQFFAIFIVSQRAYERRNRPPLPVEEYIASCHKVFENTLARHGDVVARACNAADIERNAAAGKLSMMLTMEDGMAVDGKMENLDRFYEMGVRALSLTWNFVNCFGSPNSKDPAVMAAGLTDFGKDAVVHMQDIGILVDVSHLSDGGFWDVVKLAKKPFIATHSNCRALSPHQRNMTDDMIKALADHGGVMGINFAPQFLNVDPANKRSSVERMVAMAQYEKKLGGIDIVALGSDLDGINGELEVGSPDKFELIAAGLSKGGFTDDEIDKVFSGNVMRVLKEALK